MDNELVEIVTEIVSATHNPDKWPSVCQRVVDRTGAVSFVVMAYDIDASRGSAVHMSDFLKSIASDMAKDIIAGRAAEDDAIYEATRQLDAYQLLPEWEIQGAESNEALISNPFRDEVLRRTGAVTRQCVRFNDIGPFIEIGGLHTPYGDRVPQAVAKDMAFIAPVIGKALEASRVIRRLVSENRDLLATFDQLDFGLAIVRSDGSVVVQNRSFQNLTREADGISVSLGKVVGTLPNDTSVLRKTIMQALAPMAHPSSLACSLSRKSGATPLVVKATALHEREFSAETCCMLLVLDPSDETRLTVHGLSAFGLLSAAELDVCQRLLRGSGTKEIAEQRATTAQTIRDQIKSASSKLQCQSRLDLVRLALTTRPPSKR